MAGLITQGPLIVLALKFLMFCVVVYNFCRAMLCISAAIAGTRCLSVYPSVTFMSCANTNKDIFEIFSAKPF